MSATPLCAQQLQITTLEPVYGLNYNKGYIGFTYDGSHPVGRGIAYFTKWDKISNIHATHALIVTGENSCIEADAGNNRVEENALEHYFAPSNLQIFFRKPKNLGSELAERIVQTLKPEVGKKYDYGLILAHAFSGTVAGHLLCRLMKGEFKAFLADKLDSPNQWICSELAAFALDEQPEYRDRGILATPNSAISPQMLFEDHGVFEPWDSGVAIKTKYQDQITGTALIA